LHDADVNRYPDPRAQQLTQQLRSAMQIPPAAGVLLGNGSDEIIQMLALALGGQGRTVLSVEPSFVMYRMIAAFSGLEYVGVPLTADDFALDESAMLAAIEEYEPALLFLAYPNNPTGNLFDLAAIERIIRAAPGLVVIDEAYAPFTDATFLPRLGEFDNMVVMRTVSKMGLAGLRLGLLAGPQAWIEQIDKTRLPYNINVLTQLSADFALRHKAVFDAQTESIRSMRGCTCWWKSVMKPLWTNSRLPAQKGGVFSRCTGLPSVALRTSAIQSGWCRLLASASRLASAQIGALAVYAAGRPSGSYQPKPKPSAFSFAYFSSRGSQDCR
jgi:histidinol-phosphate aminotransferase